MCIGLSYDIQNNSEYRGVRILWRNINHPVLDSKKSCSNSLKKSRKMLDVSEFMHPTHQTNLNLPFLIEKKCSKKTFHNFQTNFISKMTELQSISRSEHKPSKIHQPKLFIQFKNFYGSMVELLSY